ncbi:MAG: T9SS type A sorting domain-containing protein, partial [Cyclobacteriaceae bacterium]|nr:T9SS type A sorting domain-containing protein [Cyclobacteriaceae bacterium HetDA_MAG_MS6]
FSVTAFSDWIAAQSDQLLPVELVSFVGNAGLQSIALQWSTATEIDADYFDVERSMNQNEFVAVGRVAAAGNSESMEYYEFVDVQVTRAVDYFYRLKQVDTDGSFEYSKVIRVTSPLASLSPLLYPNPATGSIKIQKGVDISSEAVSVLDLSGKRNTLPILERQVDVSKLLPGIYIMEIDLVGRLERLPFIKVSQ